MMRGVSLIAPRHRHFRHLHARRCLSRSPVALAAAPVVVGPPGFGPGFSFSGCGWLTAFHLGVTKVLTDQGRLTASTKLYGASGGSLAAVASACDLDPDQMLRLQLDLFDHSVKHGFFFKLGELLLEHLEATLPPDAHALCTDRVGRPNFPPARVGLSVSWTLHRTLTRAVRDPPSPAPATLN